MVETRVRAVYQAKAILARLDFEERRGLAIHANGFAKEFLHPHRVRALGAGGYKSDPSGAERPILNQQRNFVTPARQIQCLFFRIPDDIQPRQSGVNVQPRDPQAVIVIPQHRRRLPFG